MATSSARSLHFDFNEGPSTPIVTDSYRSAFTDYAREKAVSPLFFRGESLMVLKELPDDCVDCVMTSPPYWAKREYANGGIGLEPDYRDFVRNLAAICGELKRVLKPEGSFWLNIGDSYEDKGLVGIPDRKSTRLNSSHL